MYHFFIEADNIRQEGIVLTEKADINHIKNVLRMRVGERICLCCEEKQKEYICVIGEYLPDGIRMEVEDILGTSRELPVEITLFQGLPKSDKMELVIQKAVELGAARIVPVASRRSVVRLDGKKAEKKLSRWREIARSAAQQSKRSRIPEIMPVMKFGEAVDYGKKLDMLLVPYEDARGIRHARQVVASVKGRKSLGVYIGPEGGFEPSEIALAKEAGAQIITLGHRILRTETAGIAILSILGFLLEEDQDTGGKEWQDPHTEHALP